MASFLTNLHSTLHHHLVAHPTITTFHWKPKQTFGATPLFLSTTVLLYLTTTLLLHRLRPSPPSFLPSLLAPLHNLLLLLLSLFMSIGCALSSLSTLPLRSLFCFPLPTAPAGPVFFYAHLFYLSKIYELLDTFLLLLLNHKPLTFLHVYHHAVVLVMCYVWLATAQSLLPIALVTNASVHVLMYAYYFSGSVGWRWSVRWKRLVTTCQILQFGFSFLVSLLFLWFHFFRGGCSGMEGWLFNAAFNASLFALFIDFHRKSYGRRRKDG